MTKKLTTIHLDTVMSPAFLALSPWAKALYPFLKLEWNPKAKNNSEIRLSYKQAAKLVGCGVKRVGEAFQELQAKGFIVVSAVAVQGDSGKRSGHAYRLTELPTKDAKETRDFIRWSDGSDFEVVKAGSNNPNGNNGKNISPTSHRCLAQHPTDDETPILAPKVAGFTPDTQHPTDDILKKTLKGNITTTPKRHFGKPPIGDVLFFGKPHKSKKTVTIHVAA